MSLRAFHIVFILASIALSVVFGLWARQNVQNPAAGIAAYILAGALLGYLVWFLKKKKAVSR